MKNFLFVSFFILLSGCQTYPKNPSMPSFWDGMEEINKNIPSELAGVSYTIVKFDQSKSKGKAENASIDFESKETN